jgi:hypothetical protein
MPKRRTVITLTLVGLATVMQHATAQPRVDAVNMYERCWVAVPIIGSGSLADPKRPMYAPTPTALPYLQSSAKNTRSGIIGFTHVLSDDGKYALVEFVAKDRSAFQAILADKTLKPFLKGRDTKEAVEAELKKYKQDFDMTKFAARMP